MARFEKVSKGQRFRPHAEEWNALLDAARYVKERSLNQGHERSNLDHDTIMVRNISKHDSPQYGLLWITQCPWRGLVAVERPAHPFLTSLAVAVEPIPAGALGRAWREGLRPLRIRDWQELKEEDFPFMAISQQDSFDARGWTGTGTIPVLAKLDESPLVLADLTGARL